jgi:hypothetical protein
LILILGSAFSLLLLSVPLLMGLLEMGLRAHRGETPRAWDVTRGVRFFAPGLLLWLAGVLAGLTVSTLHHVPIVGALAGLAVGPLVALFGTLGALCIVDRPGATVHEALGRVLLVVERNWIGFWAVSLLFVLLTKLGAAAGGFGVLVTLPWIACSWAAAYQDLFERP